MRSRYKLSLPGLMLACLPSSFAQGKTMILPNTVIAGSAFSIPTNGTGKAKLYIVGPEQAIRRDVEMGEAVAFPSGTLYGAGHYLVILAGASFTDTGELDVTPTSQPETLGFLAKPSRLPVGVHNGISGAAYVFDAYHNLITAPMSANFELSIPAGPIQTRIVTTRNGLAWVEMDSSPQKGTAKFVARVGTASSTRVIEEVPGDACRITITAQPQGSKLEVRTAPVRDCSGNAIPDGTIVSFTETFRDSQTTVDVPLKQGFARVEMPANKAGKISAASGVAAGNEIQVGGAR